MIIISHRNQSLSSIFHSNQSLIIIVSNLFLEKKKKKTFGSWDKDGIFLSKLMIVDELIYMNCADVI